MGGFFMSNVRTIKSSNYVQIHNKASLDKNLSAKAKGVLLTALALPPEYEINKTTFHEFFKDGRDSIKGGIEELVIAGYGFHEQIVSNGKFDAITLITDVNLKSVSEANDELLELIFPVITDELRYALNRIRETGETYIGKFHNDAKKNKDKNTVTENQSRKKRVGKSVSNKYVSQNGISRSKNDSNSEVVLDVEEMLPTAMHSEVGREEEKPPTEDIEKIILEAKEKFKHKLSHQMIGSRVRFARKHLAQGTITTTFENFLNSMLEKQYDLKLQQLKRDEDQRFEEKMKVQEQEEQVQNEHQSSIPHYNWLEETPKADENKKRFTSFLDYIESGN
jgi:hypothetical protein